MNEIQKKLLSTLIEKYEKSKSFIGQNKVEQNFSLDIEKVFPKYKDSREYDFFNELNNSLLELEKSGFIQLKKDGIKILKATFIFSQKNLEATYKLLKRKPKTQIQNELNDLIQEYFELTKNSEYKKYLEAQKVRILENKNVDFFSNDFVTYEDILRAVNFVLENEDEILIRDFSIKVFGNSKRFELIQNAVSSILCAINKNLEKETCLLEYSIIKTPTYVCVKGNAIIQFQAQQIDLSLLKSDIGFSTKTLQEIKSIKVLGKRVVTIENLTSFYDYTNSDDFVIYLAGFHNKVKEEFIKKVYTNNPTVDYFHFGDIDAGGFYILENLKQKTQINIKPLFMNVEILQKYFSKTISLTQNDRSRLERLLNDVTHDDDSITKTINFMLKNNCKLEQENVVVKL